MTEEVKGVDTSNTEGTTKTEDLNETPQAPTEDELASELLDGVEDQPSNEGQGEKAEKQETQKDPNALDLDDFSNKDDSPTEGESKEEGKTEESEIQKLADADGNEQELLQYGENAHVPYKGQAVPLADVLQRQEMAETRLGELDQFKADYEKYMEDKRISTIAYLDTMREEAKNNGLVPNEYELTAVAEGRADAATQKKVADHQLRENRLGKIEQDAIRNETLMREGIQNEMKREAEAIANANFLKIQKQHPVMRDPVKAKRWAAKIGEYARQQGLTDDQLSGDKMTPQLFNLLVDSMRWNEMNSKTKTRVETERKSSAGTKPTGSSTPEEPVDAADVYEKAIKDGKTPEEAAELSLAA